MEYGIATNSLAIKNFSSNFLARLRLMYHDMDIELELDGSLILEFGTIENCYNQCTIIQNLIAKNKSNSPVMAKCSPIYKS